MFAQEPCLAWEINRLLAVMAVGAAEVAIFRQRKGHSSPGERYIPRLP
jgi:hypothetical protein